MAWFVKRGQIQRCQLRREKKPSCTVFYLSCRCLVEKRTPELGAFISPPPSYAHLSSTSPLLPHLLCLPLSASCSLSPNILSPHLIACVSFFPHLFSLFYLSPFFSPAHWVILLPLSFFGFPLFASLLSPPLNLWLLWLLSSQTGLLCDLSSQGIFWVKWM